MANIKDLPTYTIFRMVKLAFAILPRRLCLFKGRILGWLFFHIDKKPRSLTISNVSSSIGQDISPRQIRTIAKNSFLHFGQFLMDLIKLSSLKNKDKLLSIEGEENLKPRPT